MCRLVQLICRVVCVAACVACGAFPRPPDLPVDGNVTSCTANEFLACEGNLARTCNATGEGTTTQDCGAAGCNADAKRCNQCVPGSDSCSTANTAEIDHCGADGLPAGHDTCPFACMAAPSAHCAHLSPRYLPDVCDAVAAMPDLRVASSATFDTSLDSNCNGGIIVQDSAPQICVVRYGSISIEMNATLTITGTRVLALVADATVAVEGVLDLSANGTTNGPGGGTLSGAQAGAPDGGGGGGFKTAGGSGGSATADGGGGAGGGAATNPSLLTVLVGGTHAKNPTTSLTSASSGGAGGSATLVACRGVVSVSGLIDAGGGGGRGGLQLVSTSLGGGGGGGSGGNVVLQGLGITVTGQMFANGGGGGAGTATPSQVGQAGTDGVRSATTVAFGGSGVGGAGNGGAGGVEGTPPDVGTHPGVNGATAGGGGGSIGFFQTYTPAGVAPRLTPQQASPAFGANKTVATR